MNIHTYSAIVLSAYDYKDYDKTITLFTPDAGILKATVKGVRKSGAKLKFAAIPFNFGNYTLSEKKGFYTVTGCEQISDMSMAMAETERYICGSIISELSESMITEADLGSFYLCMRTLKAMIFDGVQPMLATLKYILELWINSGYSGRIRKFGNEENIQTMPVLVSYVAATEVDRLRKDIDITLVRNCLVKLLRAIESKFSIALKCVEYL